MIIRIPVTREHIEGWQRNLRTSDASCPESRCAIAMAVGKDCRIGLSTMRFNGEVFENHNSIKNWIVNIDNQKPVHPFTLLLNTEKKTAEMEPAEVKVNTEPCFVCEGSGKVEIVNKGEHVHA